MLRFISLYLRINDAGEHPQPFTLISYEEVEKGIWKPKDETLLDHYKHYTKELEAKGRFKLCIWPEHCLLGSEGHAVVPVINSALQQWAGQNLSTVQYVLKGMNCLTGLYMRRPIINFTLTSPTRAVCGRNVQRASGRSSCSIGSINSSKSGTC